MTVKGANELVIFVTAGTDYTGRNPEQYCEKVIQQVAQKSFDSLFSAHLKDFQSLFNRVKIDLSPEINPFELPQNERMARVIKNSYQDPYLSELLFQYGRYLLICSSREGDLAANLQGIWNQSVQPPWSADYHININLQMNYMAAEAVNLADCHLPLFALMDSIANHGRRTAKIMYNANGWVVLEDFSS